MGLVPVHLVAQAIDDIPPVVSQTLVPGARFGHQAETLVRRRDGAARPRKGRAGIVSLFPKVDHFGDRDRERDECEREKQGKGTNGARTHMSVTTD